MNDFWLSSISKFNMDWLISIVFMFILSFGKFTIGIYQSNKSTLNITTNIILMSIFQMGIHDKVLQIIDKHRYFIIINIPRIEARINLSRFTRLPINWMFKKIKVSINYYPEFIVEIKIKVHIILLSDTRLKHYTYYMKSFILASVLV